jgi:hypothetical protein
MVTIGVTRLVPSLSTRSGIRPRELYAYAREAKGKRLKLRDLRKLWQQVTGVYVFETERAGR